MASKNFSLKKVIFPTTFAVILNVQKPELYKSLTSSRSKDAHTTSVPIRPGPVLLNNGNQTKTVVFDMYDHRLDKFQPQKFVKFFKNKGLSEATDAYSMWQNGSLLGLSLIHI